ncbi:unnamed protein product [Camellia sinensis]
MIGLGDSYLEIEIEIEIEGHLSDSDRFSLVIQRFRSISAIQIGDSSERFRSSLSKLKSKFISAIQIKIELGLSNPMSMVLPGVVGFKLSGKLNNGVTATDLVLTVTQMLRKHGVVGKFVEFYADRATIANMSPEYGATMGFFPVDKVTLQYLKLTGRSDETVAMIEAYLRANNMFVDYKEGNLISTPPTSGTILRGITRKTVIDIARDHGFQAGCTVCHP